MATKTYISADGIKVTTSDKAEIKRMKSCGWKEIKSTKVFYAKGLQDGKNYHN